MIVTGDYRGRSIDALPAGVTRIVDAAEIGEKAAQHFEELIESLPNINWSGDGHRAKVPADPWCRRVGSIPGRAESFRWIS